MKVYLKIYNQYWTGRIRSAKDGSKVYFVLTPRIENAKDLGSEENALNQLEWWCVQCGANPKEWTLEYEWDKSECERTCIGIEFPAGVNFLGFHEESAIESAIGQTFNYEDIYKAVEKSLTALSEYATEEFKKKYSISKPRPVYAMRSLTEICKTADKYYDNSVELFNLLEEVKSSDLSDVNYSFAIEYINEKIEALKDKLRTRKVRRDFDED